MSATARAIQPILDPDIQCVGYVRVSTERQAGEQYTSLADQVKAIEELAERLGVTVGHWFRDEGASGATVAGRPDFRAMLEACESSPRRLHAPAFVLVLNDSRFGRFPDPDEAAALRFRFRQAGWVVRFAEGDEVQDQTFRPVIRSLGSALASEYRRNLQRNSRRGMRGAAEQGYWTREAPYGYRRLVVYPPTARRVLEPGARKGDGEKISLTPHDAEAELVRWMFEAYASGTAALNDLVREVSRRDTTRRWQAGVIRTMLMNPTYMGDVVAGRRPASRLERQQWDMAPRSEWYGKRGAHPALVSREMFDRVQRRLKENSALRAAAVRGDYVLTGLITCPYCGCTYSGGGGGRMKSDPTARYRFYKCSSASRRAKHGSCPGPIGTITRHILEDAVIGTLSSVVGSRRMRIRMEQEIDVMLEQLANGGAGTAGTAGAENPGETERTLLARRERLVARIADGMLTESEASTQLQQIRDGLARIEADRANARRSDQRRQELAGERDRLLQLMLDFPAMARRLAGVELRELIRPWLARAEFDKETRMLTMQIRRVPALSCLPMRSRPGLTEREQAPSTPRQPVITRRIYLGQPGPEARRSKARARAAALAAGAAA